MPLQHKQHQESNGPQLADILEIEEEDWEEGQFTDANAIDHNNSTHESTRQRREYSLQFQHLDNQYSSPTNNTPNLDYYLPELDYFNTDTRPPQHKQYQNPNVYLPPPPDPRDICHVTMRPSRCSSAAECL